MCDFVSTLPNKAIDPLESDPNISNDQNNGNVEPNPIESEPRGSLVKNESMEIESDSNIAQGPEESNTKEPICKEQLQNTVDETLPQEPSRIPDLLLEVVDGSEEEGSGSKEGNIIPVEDPKEEKCNPVTNNDKEQIQQVPDDILPQSTNKAAESLVVIKSDERPPLDKDGNNMEAEFSGKIVQEPKTGQTTQQNCEEEQKTTEEVPPPSASKTAEELEAELREFLLKDENYKQMKCCGDIIEKAGGCNRIECSCGKQVCWVCLEIFDEKDDCYTHLIDKHGGYFEENEIENLIQSGAKKLLCCGNLAFLEGENYHVACPIPICRKHSCWLCLAVFPTASDCYKHLNTVHRQENE